MDTKTENDEQNPSNIVGKTLEDLKAAKETHLNSADILDHSIRIVETSKEYWDYADPESFKTSASGIASVNFLKAMAREASLIRSVAVNAHDQISQLSSSSDSLGTVTTTAYSMVCRVNSFDPRKIDEEIEKPNKEEAYARKFDAFDPELGKLYRQIFEVRRRTTSHPEKSILPDIRQAYDHLIRKLAPDDEVRAQPNWKPVDPTKPKMVSRQQRLEYAAIKHIREDTHRSTIIASTEHIIAVHNDLDKLYHTEKQIDVAQAFAASKSMIEVLNQWADVLGL